MKWWFVRSFYTLMLMLLLPYIFLRLWWRGRKQSAYRDRWLERLSIFVKPEMLNQASTIWVHAVSVGESIAAVPMVKALLKQYPDKKIVMTTTTPTGSARVKDIFKNELGVTLFHVYMPYDLPFLIRSFLNKLKPNLLVVMETEIWPNLYWMCHKNNIPIVIANARLSPLSYKGYYRFKNLLEPIMSNIWVGAQSKEDFERYVSLKVPVNQLMVTGNLKFDFNLPFDWEARRDTLHGKLGKNRPIWIAASTHPKEEAMVLDAFKQVQKQFPDLLLILVPRHPERFDEVASLCLEQGFKIARRSQQDWVYPNMDIFLGDTMGELMTFYSVANIAFVGGSLVGVGGHNLLEPAAFGVPALTGPHLHNFVEISRLLINANHTTVINDSNELAEGVIQYLQNPTLCYRNGLSGKEVIENNRGALAKLMQLISTVYKDNESIPKRPL